MRNTAIAAAVSMLTLYGCGGPQLTRVEADTHTASLQPGRTILPAGSAKLNRIAVAPVELHSFPMDEVTAPGKVEANPNRIARVAAPVAGRVGRVFVHLGDRVEQGQPLLEVDSAEAGSAVSAHRQASAQLRMAKSALAKAEADMARLEDLYQHRAAALKDVQAARNDRIQSEAGVEQAETAGREAAHRLQLLGIDPSVPSSMVTVRAPIAGKVLEIAVAGGEYRNDTNAPLMTIADLRTVWISADVPEALIRHVHSAEAVEVELAAYPGEIFRARVARIADVVDPQTRTIKVQAEIDNPAGRLRPEMFGTIRHSHSARLLPAVPASALIEADGKTVAMLEEAPGVFRRVEIAAGPRQGDLVPVTSGLRAGDRVVVDGTMLLEKR